MLYVLTQLVSTYLGLSQLFNTMKTNSIWELIFEHSVLANSLFSEYMYLLGKICLKTLFAYKRERMAIINEVKFA